MQVCNLPYAHLIVLFMVCDHHRILICCFTLFYIVIYSSDDTIWDVKRVLALQLGTQPERLSLMRGTSVLKDPVQLQDYEISDSTSLELAYA
jgi:ubiquitin-like protein 5